jgi:chromosome segregation ATPase
MSLLDKYAQINANIEEARRRVTAARFELESTNHAIENLRDNRQGIIQESQTTKGEFSRLEEELRGVKVQRNAKLEAKERVEREYHFAKREFNETRRRIDDERLAFLERCREFRSSCKRMRVAATILVLDGGAAFDVKGDLSETDVWRRLQDDDVSSDEEDDTDAENASSKTIRNGNRKKTDNELEQAVKDEKESRESFIEAECALHAAKSEHEEAEKRCNARNQKLTQQRAQLERHRKEVEDLERDIGTVNDEIVKANQESKSYENGKCHWTLSAPSSHISS